MGVDAERAADAELSVGLLHGRRKPFRIERADHVPPAVSCRGAIGFRGRVYLQWAAVKRNRRAVARQALASHRMPRHRGSNGTLGGDSLLQFLADACDQIVRVWF